MKKTDLLNAIDAFGDSMKISSHVLKAFAEDHLRCLLSKLPDEIKEIEKDVYHPDPAEPTSQYPSPTKRYSKVSRSTGHEGYMQAEYQG